MYNLNITDPNITIDGVPFFMEELKSNESFVRREFKRIQIKSGTQFISRGNYIPREYSFTTTIDIPEGRPDEYDKLFTELVNNPCEVICPDMGGIFKAEINIKKSHPGGSPTTLKLDITVKEMPEESLIPNDIVLKPENELVDGDNQ